MEVNNRKYKKLLMLCFTCLELSQSGSHYVANARVFDHSAVPI